MSVRRFARLALLALVLSTGGCRYYYDFYYYFEEAPAPPPRAMRGPPEPIDWRSLVGCWRMTRSASEEPWIFALDSVAPRFDLGRPTGPEVRQAYALGRTRPDRYWLITPRNTVEFGYNNSLHGLIFEFVPREGRLVGRATTITDMPVFIPFQRAIAVPEPCPADTAAAPSSTR